MVACTKIIKIKQSGFRGDCAGFIADSSLHLYVFLQVSTDGSKVGIH